MDRGTGTSTAWREGFAAARIDAEKIGTSGTICPYKLNSTLWAEWMAGYRYFAIGNRNVYAPDGT